MTDVNSSRWLAAYLYYNEPWEIFLAEAVEPYVRTVMQNGIANQYFFIRYWERGPHIRLRFKADPSVIQSILRPNLEEHFQTYFESKPSSRKEPSYPENLSDEFKWLPNNAIQFVAYHPELKRYGGVEGMTIAEEQFKLSSDMALNHIVKKGEDWTYDDALGIAIKLHLSFAYAMRMDIMEARYFFHFLYYNWLPNSFRYFHKQLSREEYNQQTKEKTEAFKQAFQMQKQSLVPFHEVLWEALTNEEQFEDPNLNHWISNNKAIKSKLDNIQIIRTLNQRPAEHQYIVDNTHSLRTDQKLIWSLYGDYFHMTNNRLGILNKDEGYLGYLMMESLKLVEEKML